MVASSSQPEAPSLICAALTAKQLGLISRTQALEAGISSSAIQRRLDSGFWERRLPGVYAISTFPRSKEQNWLAAVLWGGPGTALGGLAAAAHWELDGVPSAPEAEIVSARRITRPRVRARYRVDLQPGDVLCRRGIPVITPTLTLVEIAGRLTDEAYERAAESAFRRRLSFPALLTDAVAVRGRGMTGAPQARRFVNARDPEHAPTESAMESRTLQAIRKAGLPPPVPQHAVTIRGHRFRIDLAYPAHRIAIEYESERHHTGTLKREEDRRRQNLLALGGWRVVLVDKAQLRPGRSVFVDTLRALLDGPSQDSVQ